VSPSVFTSLLTSLLTRNRLVAACCAVSLAGLAACSSTTAGQPAAAGSSATLVMESSPTGPITRDFNPFAATSADNILGATDMIYEPLLQFDLLKPGQIYPWLASSYQWSSAGRTITFHLRSGVKYSNGTPFSAADVAFVFNLMKKFPAINTNGLPVTSATAVNATTAQVNFSSPAYVLLYYIASTPMVSQAVWGKVANPATYADPTPLGTGPYRLSSFSSQGIELTKNPHYWQAGEPHVAKLDFPAYDSNTSANLALEAGTLDWGGNFVSDIKAAYLDKDPSANHVWDAPLQTETLIPNLDKFPFNSVAVRQAVAAGVDRTVISADGEDNEQPPALAAGSLTGLTLPNDAGYLTPQTSQYTTTFDTAKARQILAAAGWKLGSNGFFAKGGQTLAFTIEDPSAYTDFLTDDQIMAAELKKAGMDVTVSGVSVAAWTSNLADGNFQSIAHWGNSGPSPYYLYNNWLNSALSAPVGKAASGDYERFSSKQADMLLGEFAGTDSPTVQRAAIIGLEKIVATELPVIPLFYGVAWDEYNTSKFTGWPTPADEYAPGEPSQPFNEITVLRLRPVS
jgi:peptide/nickel transport system substrate-binding protein